MKAIWKGTVLAESDDTVGFRRRAKPVAGPLGAPSQTELLRPQAPVEVEGNHYVPEAALRREHFRSSSHHTVCGWKGTASYFDVVVGAEVNSNAAWFYPEPKDAAKEITGRVAFWRGVEVRP